MINNTNMLQQIQQDQAADETVLVKFGCQSVHRHFGPPLVAYEDLQMALSNVLLGVCQINALGVVRITKELGDFVLIQPVELTQPGEMLNLWKDFVELVAEVLVPMADMDVVYADMRPGWAETANILQKRLQDGANALKLIAYESVCDTSVTEDVDQKTFRAGYDDTVDIEDYTALRHLWWQCVFTAYTWAMLLDVVKGTFDPSTFVEDFQSGILHGQFWGNIDRIKLCSQRIRR